MTSPQTILMIRHGEKPTPDAAGVDEAGASDPDGLTTVGWQRSGALAVLFVPNNTTVRSTMPTPGDLLCPHYGDTKKHRPYLTLLGTARRLGLEPRHHLGVDTAPDVVVGDLLANEADVVLMCWEHDHLLLIAQALPLTNPTDLPPAWPSDRFDVVWRFDRDNNRRYTFSQTPQQLLAGDLPTGI